jgi:hypothetical protein
VLLTYDRRFNELDPEAVPQLTAQQLPGELVTWHGWLEPIVLLAVETTTGKLHLCDFGSAGEGGTPYRSWLPVSGVSATAYSAENPLRSGRPESLQISLAI